MLSQIITAFFELLFDFLDIDLFLKIESGVHDTQLLVQQIHRFTIQCVGFFDLFQPSITATFRW